MPSTPPASGHASDEFACWGVYSRDCATRRTLGRIADKWTILIVGRLSVQPRRFGELRRLIEGISSKVLTESRADNSKPL